MKRLSVLIGLVSAQVGWGAILISWNSGVPTFYKSDGTTPLPVSSLFLAFWTPDTSVGFNPANPEVPTGGDVFLGARNTNIGAPIPGIITGYGGGDYFLEGTYGYPTDAFVPGRVYIAVFDFPYSSYSGPGSIPVGTYYAIAPTTPFGGPLTDADPAGGPPPPPDVVNYGGVTYSTTLQTIPEPGVVVLALTGSLVAVLARRRQIASGRE